MRSNGFFKFASWLSAVLVLVFAAPTGSYSQAAERLGQVRKLYVDSLGTDKGAGEMREQLVRRLRKSSEVQLVSDPGDADALLRGTGRTWVTGHFSLSPHSHGLTQPVFEGFLSVEVVGKNKEVLWSYLVTPGKFPWNGIADDLAHQVVSKLLRGIQQEGQRATSVASVEGRNQGTLRGAGATFPSPLYQQWSEQFQERHPDVHINYDAVGSAEGIQQLKEGKVDFAASEMPLSDEAMGEAHQRFMHVPSVIGAVVPIYNVKGLHQSLNFTPEILSGIFLGTIRKWNDPRIKRSNRDATLPNADIVVVHRSDGSGTSFVWTDYLSKISPQWKASVGAGPKVQWPVGVGAERNEGVASTVQQTPNSIGYVEFIYAIQHELSFGKVRNAAGEFIKASISTATAAALASDGSRHDFRVSITDPSTKDAYPIATYTWLLLPEQIEDKDKTAVLLDLVRWMLTTGQKTCSALGYAPLPMDVAKRAIDSLDAR
jgi:phosphate transport system substrate-binding protein